MERYVMKISKIVLENMHCTNIWTECLHWI